MVLMKAMLRETKMADQREIEMVDSMEKLKD